jgi:cell division protein FtsW
MPRGASQRRRRRSLAGVAAWRGARGGGRGARTAAPLEYNLLLTATLCLLAAGAVFVYSAESPQSVLSGHGDGTGYLLRFVGYGAVGLVLMRYLARGGLEHVRRLTPLLLGVAFVLLVAVKLPGIGRSVNGARRWIGGGPLQFQPSEVMKLALVLYAAHVLASGPLTERRVLRMMRPLLLVTGAACVLVMAQPDLGTALVLAFTLTAILVAAGLPLRTLGRLALGAALLVGIFALAAPYRRARLFSFIDPWAHAGTTGFQSVQGQIAIGSGGLVGRGPGGGISPDFYLPEAPTDFILAVIGEEIGALGICAMLFCYGLIAYGGLRAARSAKGSYAQLLAVGVTTLVVGQAMLNAFAVLGLAPLTGVPLPFVSYGSSSMIVMLAAMGLLLNVAGGGQANVRAVRTERDKPQRSMDGQRADSDRSGRDRRPRRAGSRGRGRAAGAGG